MAAGIVGVILGGGDDCAGEFINPLFIYDASNVYERLCL